MTAIVGVRCPDGVVIGADSALTVSASSREPIIEQKTEKKIQIIGGRVIVAASGFTGHTKRFVNVVETMWRDKEFENKTSLQIAKQLSAKGIADFAETHVSRKFEFDTFVAYPARDGPTLCELAGGVEFQPDIKTLDESWCTSIGKGIPLTEPFLALLRSVFWSDGPPNVQGGIFTVMWTLMHAVELSPGGIRDPIWIAVLASKRGQYKARLLESSELEEHRDVVRSAHQHLGEFREILMGEKGALPVPKP